MPNIEVNPITTLLFLGRSTPAILANLYSCYLLIIKIIPDAVCVLD